MCSYYSTSPCVIITAPHFVLLLQHLTMCYYYSASPCRPDQTALAGSSPCVIITVSHHVLLLQLLTLCYYNSASCCSIITAPHLVDLIKLLSLAPPLLQLLAQFVRLIRHRHDGALLVGDGGQVARDAAVHLQMLLLGALGAVLPDPHDLLLPARLQ